MKITGTKVDAIRELLRQAEPRVRTMEASGWTKALWEPAKGEVRGPGNDRSGSAPPTVMLERWRVWAEPPGRLRVEKNTDGSRQRTLSIVDGRVWWAVSEDDIETNGGDPASRIRLGFPGFIIVPDRVLMAGSLEYLGDVEVSGRPAHQVRVLEGGDSFEVDIDKEYGVVLRCVEREEQYGPVERLGTGTYEYDPEQGVVVRSGELKEAYSSAERREHYEGTVTKMSEVQEIVFDKELPPGLFEFTPPTGAEITTIQAPYRVTAVQAKEDARFTVMLPDHPEGGETWLSLMEGDGHDFTAQSLRVTFDPKIPGLLDFIEFGVAEAPEAQVEDYRIRHGGREISVHERDGKVHAWVDVAGTCIALTMKTLDLPLTRRLLDSLKA